MAIEYDPLDPAQVDDHQSVLARLRREAPVSELKPGLFYLARYQDVMDVCRAPQTFRQGRHIPRHLDTRSADQLNLGETDPPEHVRVRKVLAALLTPAKVRAMEPLIRETCRTLVNRFADSGRADIIADLAAPMTPTGIGAARSAMMSALPLSASRFTRVWQVSRMRGSMARTLAGVSSAARTLRTRPCSGGSVSPRFS